MDERREENGDAFLGLNDTREWNLYGQTKTKHDTYTGTDTNTHNCS
jgi:hypothetical protein